MDRTTDILFSYTSFCLLVHFLTQWEKFFSYMEVSTDEDGNISLRLTDNLSVFGISVYLRPPVFRVRKTPQTTTGTKRTPFQVHRSVIPLSNFLNLHKVMYSTSTLWTFQAPSDDHQTTEGCTIRDPNSGEIFLRFKPGSIRWPSLWEEESSPSYSGEVGQSCPAVILYVPDLIHSVSAVCLLESSVRFILRDEKVLLKSRNHDGEISMSICDEVSDETDKETEEEHAENFKRQVRVLSGPFKTVLSSMSKCRFVHIHITSERPCRTRSGTTRKKQKPHNLCANQVRSNMSSLQMTCILNQIKCCFHFMDSVLWFCRTQIKWKKKNK